MRIPKYRHFKPRNRAYVEYHGKRSYLPGEYGSAESQAAYRAFLRKIHIDQQTPGHLPQQSPVDKHYVTLNFLAIKYLDWAADYYPMGHHSTYENARRSVMRVVGKKDGYNFGWVLAKEFGPLLLKDIQKRMIDEGHSRSYINDTVSRIKHWIKWCASEELIEPSVWHGLQTVAGLKKGRTPARETKKRLGVDWRDVEPVFEHLQPTTQAMLWLQWYSGARSQSIVLAKPEQFMWEGNVLLWKPRHKTEFRGVDLVLPLGPKCQEKVKPFLDRPAERYMFSPHDGRNSSNRRYRPKYQVWTYRQAIVRAQDNAIKKTIKENEKLKAAGQEELHVPVKWTPHQLRHARGTLVRAQFGIEAAQATLGHETLDATQIYAAKRFELAKEVAMKVG